MADVGYCKAKCPGGAKCRCTAHPHALHICSDPGCPCHSADRYDGTLAVLDVGAVDPLGMHWRAATVLRREAVTA